MPKNKQIALKSIIEEINTLELSEEELSMSIEKLNISDVEISASVSKINFLRANLSTQNVRRKSEILSKAYSRLMEFKERNTGNAKKRLMSLLGSTNSELQLHFSKLKDIDDKEALDILEDALLLKLIDEIKNDD